MAQEGWAEERKLGSAAATCYSGPVNGQDSNAGTAPSYVSSQYVDGGRPKGSNLMEGGFDSDDAKNASFNNEIGTKMDPGRLAEQKMTRENADAAGDAAGDAAMPRQKGVSGDNTFDALEGDTSA
jgi:hypothetical protein